MAKGGFRGMPGGMNQAAMMKQAQKMQQEMLRMQEEMENKTYSATTGGGMVTAAVNGKHELKNLVIDPEAVDMRLSVPPCDDILMPFTAVIPLQMIAYHTAVLRGNDVDKPRNLAKSVTVE